MHRRHVDGPICLVGSSGGILHLNGDMISNPTTFARIEPDELDQFLRGCGWTNCYVERADPAMMHEAMACVMDQAIADI